MESGKHVARLLPFESMGRERDSNVIIDIKSSLNEIDICLVFRFNYAQTISMAKQIKMCSTTRCYYALLPPPPTIAFGFLSAHREYRLRRRDVRERIWTNNCVFLVLRLLFLPFRFKSLDGCMDMVRIV